MDAMELRRLVVKLFDAACQAVDGLLYRPFAARLLGGARYSWRCQFARAAFALDARWGTGHWEDGGAPLRECEACRRRAAWLCRGGWALESEEERGFPLTEEDTRDFMANRVVDLCSWCDPELSGVETDEQLRDALATAGRRSTTWAWSSVGRGDSE
jgi:hypothetical protein